MPQLQLLTISSGWKKLANTPLQTEAQRQPEAPDGAFAYELDGHGGVGAHAVARDAAGGVGGAGPRKPSIVLVC